MRVIKQKTLGVRVINSRLDSNKASLNSRLESNKEEKWGHRSHVAILVLGQLESEVRERSDRSARHNRKLRWFSRCGPFTRIGGGGGHFCGRVARLATSCNFRTVVMSRFWFLASSSVKSESNVIADS